MPAPTITDDFHRRSTTPSGFAKESSSSLVSSASTYLAAFTEAEARTRSEGWATLTTSTPALSLSSSQTSSSEDAVLEDSDDDSSLSESLKDSLTREEHVEFTTVHTEFGHCANLAYRYTSRYDPGAAIKSHEEQDPPYYITLTTYVSFLILICLGHLRDLFGKRFNKSAYRHLIPRDGYAPLHSDFDSFYTRRLKTRMDECFSQPVTGVAGRTIVCLDRYSPDYNKTQILTGGQTRTLNISSYNYLGFAQAAGGCADAVEECLKRYGISTCGPRLEGGTNDLHILGEALVASFIGAEAALISSMGFATNSTIIPALVGKGCLVISDELNHSSLRFGVRISGANVRMFKHNDMKSLEALLREVISQGQPKTHRPWKKILVIVEGLYSMEGTIVNLPAILELKRRYKFYLFVDEAHSIGALGPHGRGVTDYFNIPPRHVDVLMGTFTKSFGAAGGYIAGSKTLIDSLRIRGASGPYAESMTPPVLTQIISSMASIMGVAAETGAHPGPTSTRALPGWMALPPAMRDGSEGQSRLRRLAFNLRYLSRGLRKLGFIVYGHMDSPVVPLLLFNPGKMRVFQRMMREREPMPIVVVVVGYPATPLLSARVRFCVSASHTKEDIDAVLTACDEIGDVLDLKHGPGERWPLQEIITRAVELVRCGKP